MMREYLLRIDNVQRYKADVKKIRESRRKIQKEEIIEIQVVPSYNAADKDKMVKVRAKGPNLWVVGFVNKSNEESFRENDKYSVNDRGIIICKETICDTVKSFIDKIDAENLDEQSKEIGFLILTFVASEMVRNEIMEAVYFSSEHNPSWTALLPFLKNWESASKILYPIPEPELEENFLQCIMTDRYKAYRELKEFHINKCVEQQIAEMDQYVYQYYKK